ncbi:hypothetical protein YC2023_062747 [Brassica napus]
MESEAFLKRDVASNALTLVESEQDKLEREIRRDKWMQYPIRDIAELLSSTQSELFLKLLLPCSTVHLRRLYPLQDIESFPEAVTDLVGKTFMFGIYIESNNVASKGGMYKVGKVWKDLSMLLTGGSTTESWTHSDVGTSNLSGSQVWVHFSYRKSGKRKHCDKAKGKQPQCSKRIRANGDNNNDRVQLSNILTRRSTCLQIQPRNLLPAFSNSDSVKQHNENMWSTSQVNESEKEDDLESSLDHNFTDEGEDYSDQSYDDVSSEDSDSHEVGSDNTEEISDTSHVPDEQRARILTMADIFKTMFQGGQSSSTTPLPKLNTTRN